VVGVHNIKLVPDGYKIPYFAVKAVGGADILQIKYLTTNFRKEAVSTSLIASLFLFTMIRSPQTEETTRSTQASATGLITGASLLDPEMGTCHQCNPKIKSHCSC
jgi:hypothetical protein